MHRLRRGLPGRQPVTEASRFQGRIPGSDGRYTESFAGFRAASHVTGPSPGEVLLAGFASQCFTAGRRSVLYIWKWRVGLFLPRAVGRAKK